MGTLGIPGYANPKWYYQLVENFRVYLQGKKSASPLMLFWRYCKDIQTSHFGYFGHAWLQTPKMIVSSCRRLWCFSVCQNKTSSFISFLRHYILKNSAIWLADRILANNSRTRIFPVCQILDWWWNINNNPSFHFRLIPRKNNDNIFQKIQKTLFCGHF